uniref:Lamina-associated polypeptide 2, isoforms beta/delta/epsilon/gamma-like n=1 Tax=Sinocyclocheilus grahami TaxID=75366 RepID=A0A672K227_SINGR
MPVFEEDPALFSKEELIAHTVDLPPPESKKHAYVELYLKHERTGSTDFSSDEEEGHLTGSEPVTDVLSEMFPDTAKTPTGIYATKRRPIKGAAGRPVQFKYPEMPLLSPTTLERQEIQQRLVPLWVQIVVFLLVVCLLYLIYASMEEPLSNPFTALLEGLQEAALIYTSED